MKPIPHLLHKGTIPLQDVQYIPLFSISPNSLPRIANPPKTRVVGDEQAKSLPAG
jgi:hypothetical protein